jgi:hypothetical protein
MRLLALEARQNATYYQSRYRQIEFRGAELYVLNGEGTDDFWPAERYRIAGSAEIGDLIAAAKAWHAELDFDGVLTFSESAVVAVAAVAEALGLPGVGVEAARTSRNKLLMRQAHERGGAAHPRFRFVEDVEDAVAAGHELGWPVILKPTLGAASNFVFRVDDEAQMRRRHADAVAGIAGMSWVLMEADGLDLGPNGLLVESFLDGHEHLIEAVAWDGEVFLGSIVDRVTVEGATFDDDVHHAPTRLDPAQVAAVHELVTAAARGQGLHRAVLHAEVRFHAGVPHILEIAVRPGGGGLDYMARISAGHCPILALMEVSRGVPPAVTGRTAPGFAPTDLHTAAMCLVSPPGRLAALEVPDDVRGSDRLFLLKLTAKPGDLIRRPPDGNTILGFLGAIGASFDDAMGVATELAARIEVEVR